MQSFSSLPQTKTGFWYSSEIFPATSPSTPMRQLGLPITITSFISLFLKFLFTSRMIPVTIIFLSSFIFDRCSASTPACTSFSVARSSNARIGSSIRDAAFNLGVIIKPTSSSVKYLWSIFILAKSFCNPGRGDLRKTFIPKYAMALFSPIRGTMSERVASPAMSSIHFSAPSFILKYSPYFFRNPCTNLNITPAPHNIFSG